MAPMRYSQAYLLGTFFLFLTSNLAEKVENIFMLTVFVLLAYSLLYAGYKVGILTKKNKLLLPHALSANQTKRVRVIVLVGSIYFLVWGVNQLIDFGATSPIDVFSNITNPGSAYSSKFSVYEERLATNTVNRVTQILILLSLVYAIYIPMLVFYWKKLGLVLRVFSLVSVAIYVISFLFIGTQKGLGDVILFAVSGFAILLASGSIVVDRALKRKIYALTVVLLCLAFTYMAINQASRFKEFGLLDSLMFGDVSNTWISQVLGKNLALGVYSILGYPSHGYLGLSYNLDQDFVFSYGAGFSQAFESYRYQFFGGSQNFFLTYPARTEVITGWPAGMYWSTAFPWFASDITFFGCLLLMFVVGFFFSRTWLRCIGRHDPVSFASLGQFFIFIAFLPANNQVLMQRQGLWTVVTIVFIRFFQKLIKGSV
ncbi:hypothetical protein [Cupriavidus sp. SK-3]|uniref:hypothetical protein n=1 Tax=Cupriavidus sp. SK-3 TaxID=1470558 RepID=UPI0012680249|nr:hypothetical protein [Cupriavidus sp. SK-3]